MALSSRQNVMMDLPSLSADLADFKLQRFVRNMFYRIVTLGMDHIKTDDGKRRLVLCNQINLLVFLTSVFYAPLFYALGQPFLAQLCIPFMVLFLSPFLFNYFGFVSLGKIVLILWSDVSILVFGGILGADMGFHYVLFAISALPLVFFSLRQVTYIFVGCALSVVSFVVLEWQNFSPPIQYSLPDKVAAIIHLTLILLTFVLILLTVLFFYLSNERAKQALQLAYERQSKSIRYAENVSKQASYANLVSRIAHEIRNPLTVIQTSADMTLNPGQTNEKIADCKQLISDNIQRLLHIIDVMLKYGNTTSDLKEKMTIKTVLDDVVYLAKTNPIYGAITIHAHTANVAPMGLYSSGMYHALLSILSNAAQSINGRGNIWIHIHGTQDVDNAGHTCEGVAISIRDDGAGIPIEDLERVQDPFYTTKHDGSMGLGLPTAIQSIHRHNGTFKIDSDGKSGTTAVIFLPY